MSQLASSPRYLEDVYEAACECNKCSLCQAVCPTYVVNPVEWETARGRVALIRDAIEGRLELRDIASGPLSTCLTCNNCVAACAPAVPTAEIVARARQELHDQEGQSMAASWALRSLLPRPGAMRWLRRISRAIQVTGLHWLARKGGFTRWLGAAGALMEQAGPLPKKSAHQRLRHLPEAASPRRDDVTLLICCYQNLAAPEISEASAAVLLANGFDVKVPELGCFGLPAYNYGDRDASVEMAARTTERLADSHSDALVGDVASCTSHLSRYPTLLANDGDNLAAAKSIAKRTFHVSNFLQQQGLTAPLGSLRWKVAVDEPCSLPLDDGIRHSAHGLLSLIPNLELVPLTEAAMCCGGPGMYFHQEEDRSMAILRRKFDNIIASGADTVVTENISCLLQLRRGAQLFAPHIRVMHVMQALAESIRLGRQLAG